MAELLRKPLLRKLAHRLLPVPVIMWLRRFRAPPKRRSALPVTRDISHYRVQDHIDLEASWLTTREGQSGPCASLYAYGEEVLRIDCLGGADSHLHINLRQQALEPSTQARRFYFQDASVQDHIERAAFELRRNSSFCLALNPDPRIRRMVLDEKRLDEAATWLREQMHELLDKRAGAPALPPLPARPRRVD